MCVPCVHTTARKPQVGLHAPLPRTCLLMFVPVMYIPHRLNIVCVQHESVKRHSERGVNGAH